MNQTILIMAGGTGGHIFPALAVAELLRSIGWTVTWLGVSGGMEERLIPPHGYAATWISFGGVRGKGWMRKCMLPFALLVALWQSAKAIFKYKPQVVLGMGGYAAFPGGLVAALLGKPLVIHEQNAVPGLTNRILAAIADRVLTAFPDAFAGRVNVIWSGNPVRADIVQIASPEYRYAQRTGRLKILIVGGSLGAQAINQVMPKALALLPPDRRPQIVHQSGAAHFAALQEAYHAANVDAEVLAFIDNMAIQYAGADLVICRAGAMTVSELAVVGVASLLIPYPHAVDDHQTQNANYLVAHEAAVLIPQSQLTAQLLSELLDSMRREQLLKMACAARAAGKPDAATRVAQYCAELVTA